MSLDIEVLFSEVAAYFQANPYIGYALAAVLLLLMFRKPKLFLTLVLIVSVLVGALYVISNVSEMGVAQKKRLINENALR